MISPTALAVFRLSGKGLVESSIYAAALAELEEFLAKGTAGQFRIHSDDSHGGPGGGRPGTAPVRAIARAGGSEREAG